MNTFKPGDQVTCKHKVHAYYSGYAGNPSILFTPGMVGEVVDVAPKVRIIPQQYRYSWEDGHHSFLSVKFFCTVTKKTQRVNLNYCNAVKVNP